MELYIRRNIPECMKEGWTLLTTNLSYLCKSLWWSVLIFAVIGGIGAPLFLDFQKQLVLGNFDATKLIPVIVIFVAYICATIIFTAKLFQFVNKQTNKVCLLRTLKVFAVNFCITLILVALFGALFTALPTAMKSGVLPPTIAIAILLLLCLICLIITFVVECPLMFAYTKYMLESDMKLKNFWKAYKRGFNNIGKILGFFLLSMLIVIVISSIVSLPYSIASLAAMTSFKGLAFGDPEALPKYFMLTYGLTAFISQLLTAIIYIWYTFAQCHLYGSIEAKYLS